MSVLAVADPWSDMLAKGAILWRNVAFHRLTDGKIQAEVPPFVWRMTEKSSFMARIRLDSQGLYEPELIPILDGNTAGITIFLNHEPSKDWTHIIINGVSNVLRQPGKQKQGGCVFGQVPKPYSMDAYLRWREEMFTDLRSATNEPFERILELSVSRWVSQTRPSDMRLVLMRAFHEDKRYYDYEILRAPEIKQCD